MSKINNGVDRFTGQAILGKNVWYFIQSVEAKVGDPGLLPAFQTDGSLTLGGENIDEQTKQGRIIVKATDEHSIDLTQYFIPGDESIKVIEDAKISGKSVKVWRVVVDDESAVTEGDHKAYPAKFGYGMPDQISYADGSDLVEVSYTLNIVGSLKEGTFPLSDEDIQIIRDLYDYQRPGETTGDYDQIDRTEEGSS